MIYERYVLSLLCCVTITDPIPSLSICSSALQMNFLAQSPRSVAQDNPSSISHGLPSRSSQPIGIVSTTLEKSWLTRMPSNTSSHMEINQLFGVLSQHLKGFRRLGRINATQQDMCCMSQLSHAHLTSSRGTIISSMRRLCIFLLSVSNIHFWVRILTFHLSSPPSILQVNVH